MLIGKHLPYPTLTQVLMLLDTEAVLVGSAVRNVRTAKDYDFVLSRKGLALLLCTYGYYLARQHKGWYVFFPEEHGEPVHKAVDFFCGLQPIDNKAKYENRITYEQTMDLSLTTTRIAMVDVFSYLT